jgi:hypothetical protein
MKIDPDQHHSEPPSIQNIESLLGYLKPNPSPRFNQRLQKAPWKHHHRSLMIRRWGFAMLVILCSFLVAWVIFPPLQTMARSWILYFWPDRQDQMQVSLADINPQDLFQYASPENFPFSISQVANLAGFPVKQPTSCLPGMEFVGGRYEAATKTVVMLYQGAGYNLFLSQRPIEAGQEYFSIGASAEVQEVSIGDIPGEYVTGGWVTITGTSVIEQAALEDLQVAWDANLPQYTLRWQYQGYAYQLRSTGSHGPQKFELITLAQDIR